MGIRNLRPWPRSRVKLLGMNTRPDTIAQAVADASAQEEELPLGVGRLPGEPGLPFLAPPGLGGLHGAQHPDTLVAPAADG